MTEQKEIKAIYCWMLVNKNGEEEILTANIFGVPIPAITASIRDAIHFKKTLNFESLGINEVISLKKFHNPKIMVTYE